MKISILSQLMQIVLSGLLGFAFGFLYDTFKVLRRNSGGKAFSAFMDALFCITVCFALFITGMSAGEGSIDLAMLIFAGIGFCGYILLLSDRVFSSLHRAFGIIKQVLAKVFSPIEKILKKLFSKAGDAFKQRKAQRHKHGGQRDAKEKNDCDCRSCNYGDDSLWSVQPYRRS